MREQNLDSDARNTIETRLTMHRGIITGCDARQEWLLPWWWRHYRATNTLSVTLFDFGITASARRWCESRMAVCSFPPPRSLFFPKEALDPSTPWLDRVPGYVWSMRPIWFTKAFCLKQAPYTQNLWLDLDCEVKASLAPLFSEILTRSSFALTRDAARYVQAFHQSRALRPEVIGYQAGVLLFHRTSSLLNAWTRRCYSHCNREFSEQSALSHLLHQNLHPFALLPEEANWLFPDTAPSTALIVHHSGAFAKRRLMETF